MKKKMRGLVFAMLFSACMAGFYQVAYAEPETEATTQEEGEPETADNRLASLEIAQAVLSPGFDPEQLTYTAVVPNEVTRIALRAETVVPEAKKVIKGTSDLQVGENSVVITVTAADGAVREYRITVTREAAGEPGAAADPGTAEEPGAADPGTAGEPGGESSGGEEPGTREEPGTGEPEDPSADPGIPGETGGQAFPTEPDQTSPSASGGDIILSTEKNPGGQDNPLASGGLSGRNFLLLILAVVCLVLVFIILAILLLRRHTEDDELDDEEYGDEEYEGEEETDGEKRAKEWDGGDYGLDGLDDDFDGLEDDDPDDGDWEDGDYEDGASEEDSADGQAEAAGMVTPEELARFYQALNLPEEAVEPEETDVLNGLEVVDLDEDEDLLEDDDDFDFLDF